jgi:toxin YoeB
MYKIIYTRQAEKDYLYWISSGNVKIVKRIAELLEDTAKHPCTGIGKPKPLKYELAGKWSRRIDDTHRFVYSIHDDTIEVYVFSMRYHYSK